MGFFGKLFGGEKSAEFSDRVWSRTSGKLRDLADQVRASLEAGHITVVVFHFRDAGQYATAALSEAGIDLEPINDFSQLGSGGSPTLDSPGSAALMPSEVIPFNVRQENQPARKDSSLTPVDLHLVEHHPAPERDGDVLKLDRVWDAPVNFTAYVALDEPWLRPIGMDRIRKIMSVMGLDDDTLIQSEPVTSSLTKARKRLGKGVNRELPADSCEEWMKKNQPDEL